MTDEAHLAFAHPEFRAAATAGNGLPDRISLRDHIAEVEIGAFQAERGTTQRISFNIVVEVVPVTDPVADDVDRILSYDRVTEAIDSELAAERVNLLETLAERVADRILREPQASRVFVRIEKLDRGAGALGVEIARSRTDIAPQPCGDTHDREAADMDALLHPVVIYLSNEAITSAKLAIMIDTLVTGGQPLIFCVGLPETARPITPASVARLRIDLLAIEQNAWNLAGRDPRCVVVNSRTEIDWGLKNGQISVWAPSKIILDAIDGPDIDPIDALDLAVWFARLLHAAEIVTIGVAPPMQGDIPSRAVPLMR